MINVCPQCGQYEVAKTAFAAENRIVCPICETSFSFQFLPLYCVTGASSAGKTTTALALRQMQDEFVVLDQDILWRDEFNQPEDNYAGFRDTWLRLAKNINQAGRPVILFGSAVPEQFERPEARYFSAIHFLALVADDATIAQRCRARPAWRRSSQQEEIDKHVAFNRWLQENGQAHGVALLATTNRPVQEVAAQVLAWARQTNVTKRAPKLK